MKALIYFSIIALCACFFTSCATPQRPPAANDWTTEYVGRGRVKTSITNASGLSLFLKIRSGGVTAAQVQLFQNGTRDVFLGWGGYGTVMKITAAGAPSYYRGPGFYIPPNSARMGLTLQPANSTNLTPISREEFER